MSVTSPLSPVSSSSSGYPPPALTSSSSGSRYHPTTNSCHCLNLQITITPLSDSSPTSTPSSSSSHPLLQALTSDPTSPFYAHECLLAHLDSKAIQQGALTVVRAFSVAATQWVLFRCLACRMDCFAVEADSADGADGRCVMRLDMLSSEEEINELHSSPHFSSAFNMLIPTPRSSPLSSPTASSGGGGGGTAGSAAESLRVALDRSIHAEQLAMQMRINQFVAEEQARFAAWEKKGKRELTQLLTFLQETSSGRQSLSSGDLPGSPYASIPRSPAPTPISPRPSSPTSATPASMFQPLHTFLRRPSRQSPRLQRLLMDGLRHSSTMSPTDSHSPAVSARTVEASDDDSGGTPRHSAVTLSSSLPRTGRMSPRQSVSGLAVPQLSGLIRRGSRSDDVEEEEEEEEEGHKSGADMIVRWREDEERQREEEEQQSSAQSKQRRSAAQRRKASGAQHDKAQQDPDEEDIFQLDTSSAEDSWTGEGAEREEDDEDEEAHGLREEKGDRESRVRELVDEHEADEELNESDEAHEDGALSDDEAVATTSQADILAIARRSSVSFVPIPSAASQSAASRSSARQLGLVPSSLPIPIPAPLRQLINKQQQQQDTQPSQLSSSFNRQLAPPRTTSHNLTTPPATHAALSSSVVDAPRRASLHSLALERKQLLQRSQPITDATTYTAQRSLSPEPSATGQPPAAQSAQTDEPEPFIPPHTLVAEPYFSFSKFRHLAGVKMAGSLGSGGLRSDWGMLSSSVPSRSMVPSQVLFKKDEQQARKSSGASALSAALGGRKSSTGSGM